MQQQEKNNKGFNILELLVVLAIVGIMSAVAYPNFSSWTKERKVRQASERIQSLMKNILIQTERGTFAYVQVLFENNDSNLIVTSKGMTMQTLATKINDANDDWNDPNKVEDRCNTTSTNYWDTDLDATSDEIKNAVYSIILEEVTTNFKGVGEGGRGAVCFARNGKFFEGSDELAANFSTPYEFIYICRRVSEGDTCAVTPDSDDVTAEFDINPLTEVEYLRRIHWGRFGNISIRKFKNKYEMVKDSDTGDKEKVWVGGEWLF